MFQHLWSVHIVVWIILSLMGCWFVVVWSMSCSFCHIVVLSFLSISYLVCPLWDGHIVVGWTGSSLTDYSYCCSLTYYVIYGLLTLLSFIMSYCFSPQCWLFMHLSCSVSYWRFTLLFEMFHPLWAVHVIVAWIILSLMGCLYCCNSNCFIPYELIT